MDGLAEKGQEIAKECKGTPALDSGFLAAAQVVETPKSLATAPCDIGAGAEL